MRCPDCKGVGFFIVAGHDPACRGDCAEKGLCPIPVQEICERCEGTGEIETFWSDAERAGLKAMGLQVIKYRALSREYPRHMDRMATTIDAIRAYVQTSIKAKGGAFNKQVGSDKANKEEA